MSMGMVIYCVVHRSLQFVQSVFIHSTGGISLDEAFKRRAPLVLYEQVERLQVNSTTHKYSRILIYTFSI